jgi:hypothetical protein
MAAVRRLFAWIAGLVGIAALARLLSARQARVDASPLPGPPVEDDPAEALRRKLSETRDEQATASATADRAVHSTDDTDSEPAETLDDRRARIHAKAQEAIDAMQEPPA